uniref:Uncharacterized protein n=1 Tax=Globodera rostochiensis TaxID=31243 RepID=A0A914I811_GLORO
MSRTQFPCLAGRINQIAASGRCQPPLLQPSCDDGKFAPTIRVFSFTHMRSTSQLFSACPVLGSFTEFVPQMLIAGETKTTTLVAPQQHPSPFILLSKQQRNTDRFLTYTAD